MITNEVLNAAPEIGAAVGYTVGQVAEHIALLNIRRNRTAIVGAHEGAKLGRHQGRLHRAVAQLALVGAISGFAFGHMAERNDGHVVAPPALTVLADHSFDTALNGAAARVNTVAGAFANEDGLEVQGLVAHNGSSDPIDLDKLSNDQPYGPASLDSTLPVALGEAYNNSVPAQSNVPGTGESRNAGVLVVTDNNSIGSEQAVLRRDRIDGNIPVFIVNVGSKDSKASKQVTTELQSVADKTGGKYWDASTDAGTVASAIKQEIKPREIKVKSTGDKLDWAIVGFAAAAAGILQFFRRKRETAIS